MDFYLVVYRHPAHTALGDAKTTFNVAVKLLQMVMQADRPTEVMNPYPLADHQDEYGDLEQPVQWSTEVQEGSE